MTSSKCSASKTKVQKGIGTFSGTCYRKKDEWNIAKGHDKYVGHPVDNLMHLSLIVATKTNIEVLRFRQVNGAH